MQSKLEKISQIQQIKKKNESRQPSELDQIYEKFLPKESKEALDQSKTETSSYDPRVTTGGKETNRTHQDVLDQFFKTDLEDMYIPLDGFQQVQLLIQKEYPQYMDKFTTFSTENDVWRMKGINVEKREFIRMAYSDGELRQHCRKVDNISFEEQLKLQKVLVEPQDGEESDMDSEQEEPVTKRAVPQPVLQPKSDQPQQTKRNRQIFKHLTVLQKEGISLPPIKPDLNAHRPPLTLFIELDDVFLHTFLCDENFGYMANPNSKEPEHEFLIQENQQPVLVYERDYMREFLDFLLANKPQIEPVLFTTGDPVYAERLLKIVDPERKIFEHAFFRNACYLFEHQDEEITVFVKDIARFKTRDIKRSVLLDPKPLSFMMTPENGMPVIPYQAEYDAKTEFNEKDNYLLTLIEEIEKLAKMDDVRPYLDSTYQLRQKLKSAKLV